MGSVNSHGLTVLIQKKLHFPPFAPVLICQYILLFFTSLIDV